MFNNADSSINGEQLFFNKIKNNINVIFDVGCRQNSEFLNFNGECHYFDPVKNFIDNLSEQSNINKKSYFNNFGLGNENKELFYFPRYQSFFDRVKSCGVSDNSNKIILKIRKAVDYIHENSITKIDFLKIDTEGFELDVLKGFEHKLCNVNIIQFEYGGTYLDSNNKLIDVINYLKSFGFHSFSYLVSTGTKLIIDYKDHYQYCNIVCLNKDLTEFPY
jgi:FkbM family methyltransferase